MENMIFKRKIYNQPIEVKSSGYKTHASLDAFCQKFSEDSTSVLGLHQRSTERKGRKILQTIQK